MKIQSPCKDCNNRYMGCHSECCKYSKFKADLSDYKESIPKPSVIEEYYISDRAKRYKRYKK